MNTTTYSIALVFMTLLGSLCIHPLYAQTGPADCAALVQDYVKRMAAYSRPEGKKIYFMDMQVDTYYRPGYATADSHVGIKMYIGADKLHYQSDYMSFYSDSKDAFTIVHPQKIIVWNSGGDVPDQAERYRAISALNDSLFAHSKVISCENKEENNRHLIELVLLPDAIFTKATRVSKIVYQYDKKEQRVYRSEIYYTEVSPRKKEVITYHRLDFNHPSMPFSKAENAVLNTGGGLQARFRNYELIDNRKHSR